LRDKRSQCPESGAVVPTWHAVTKRVTAREVQPAAPPSGAGRRNRAAVERTITGLRQGGKLEDVDAATVGLARHLATALDTVDPLTQAGRVAQLARVYLATLRSLRGVDEDSERDTDLGDLLALLSAPVGDPPQL
jgi:hypothetical protein